MKIYFDGIEVNSDYYAKLQKSAKVYDGYFKLGSTICENYKLSVNKEAISEMPSVVTIYENNELVKTLYVVDYNDEDDNFIVFDLEDSMTKFNFPYDASQIFVDGKTTLGAIFTDICQKAGVNTEITTFYKSDMEVNWYDNTFMARDYLSYIAEINGKNLRISANDKLEFVDINTQPVENISFDDISKYKIGVQHTITRVVLGDWQFGNEDGETYYINEDNVYATSEEVVEHIYNIINGFTYYNFKANDCPMNNLKAGDLVSFTYENNTYITFVQYTDITFSGDDWFGGIEVNLESPVKQETEVLGEQARYRRIKRIVDQQTGRIIQIIEEQNEQGERMSTIEQSLEQIESQIVDIPTITTESEGTGRLYLSNLLNTRLISLKIHPTDRDILGLFASTQLKVALGLKVLSRGVTLEGSENNYYLIPDNLYFLGNVYDEFIYDGAKQTIQVIHRIGIENGQKYVLDEPIIENFEYRDIIVGDGNYNVFMSSYPTAYIYIKAMIQNDYTNTFATKYEVDSKITQTANEINLEVNKKVNDEDFTGANIMLKVNEDESQAQINADKISLAGKTIEMTSDDITINSTNFKVDKDGKVKATNGEFSGEVKATTGNISGWVIDNQGINNGVVFLHNDGSSTIYTVADLLIVRNYILETPGFSLPGNMLKHYDFNNDGQVTASDYVILQQLIGINMSN